MNIIIKNTPSWRPLQPNLGKFKTLHPKGLTAKHLSVEEQYSKEELAKIQAACHFTKTQIKDDELHKDSLETTIDKPKIKRNIT